MRIVDDDESSVMTEKYFIASGPFFCCSRATYLCTAVGEV